MNTTLCIILLAGFLNASFAVPTRYLTSHSSETLWCLHSLIGFVLFPWLCFILNDSFSNLEYFSNLPTKIWLILSFGGFIFGLGQLCFAKAIEKLGIAKSFCINIGIGVALGSLFTLFYHQQLWTIRGLSVCMATISISVSLGLQYYLGLSQNKDQSAFYYHWLCALCAGIASGLQNIIFVISLKTVSSSIMALSSFWIWPPFLTVAGATLFIGLLLFKRTFIKIQPLDFITTTKLSIGLIIMGFCFTGSLLLYSFAMDELSKTKQLLVWPTFMITIILTTQWWGWFFKEALLLNHKQFIYKLTSIFLLMLAMIILSFSF